MPRDQAVDVGRLRVERLPAREGEQPVGQRRRALGRALGRVDVAVDIADPALRDAGLQQLQAAVMPVSRLLKSCAGRR